MRPCQSLQEEANCFNSAYSNSKERRIYKTENFLSIAKSYAHEFRPIMQYGQIRTNVAITYRIGAYIILIVHIYEHIYLRVLYINFDG